MPIKTFRGKMADGDILKIQLSTSDGSMGYRINDFKVIPHKPTTSANECVLQIFKQEPSAASAEINFGNNLLLAVGIYSNQTDTTYYPDDMTIAFDREIFNQDIFITHVNTSGAEECNFYLELESMKLDLNENTLVTLKDIRNTNSN